MFLLRWCVFLGVALALGGCGGPEPGFVHVSPVAPTGALGAMVGLGTHHSLGHVTYGGPKQTLSVVAMVEEPGGGEVKRISAGSFSAPGGQLLDADVWVEVVSLGESMKPRWLCTVRFAESGGGEVARFFLDELIPETLDGKPLGGTGAGLSPAAARVPDDRAVWLFQSSLSYGGRNRTLRVGFELR